MEFLTCSADLDIWMKLLVRPKYGLGYNVDVLIYVDDVLVIHNDADSVLRRINKYFKLDSSSIGDHAIYLGPSGRKCDLRIGYGHGQISQKGMSRNWWQIFRSIWLSCLMRFGSCRRRSLITPL